MKLIRNADVYAPEHLGHRDILVEGERITAMEEHIDLPQEMPFLEQINAAGQIVTPGFVDLHEHITGGGGEGGPSTRVPEASLKTLIQCGVTTVVGLLGTDGISRSLENLLAKAQSFEEEGITARILSGSYGYPPVTFFGSPERDLQLLDMVIGVKTAMSDHRSSNIGSHELIALGTDVRRGSMLGGKAGFVTIHMGSGKAGLRPLLQALEESDLPPRTFLPTHMSRTDSLLQEGVQLMAMGGRIDLTAGEDAAENRALADRIADLLKQGFRSGLSVSSDAYGSMPRFNENKELIGLTYGTPSCLQELLRILVQEKSVPLEEALCLFTANPAAVMGMSSRKGTIQPGSDADLLLYDEHLQIQAVLARGRIALQGGIAYLHGRFE